MNDEDKENSLSPIARLPRRQTFLPTDLGNTRLFVAEHRNDIRNVPGIGWLIWDGTRWAPDVDGAILRLAKATIDGMYIEAAETLADAVNIADATERKSVVAEAQRRLNHALKSQAEGKLLAMVSVAESELPIIEAAGNLDQPPLLLNTPSGTVDLTDVTLREHRREDLLTRMTAAAYDPDAIAPRWIRFLREIMAGDETRIAYLQRAIGYSVTGLTREQKIFMLLGDGANGKSVLGKTVVKLLGDYGAEVEFESFLIRQRGRTRGDLVRLRGSRFGVASEMLPGEKLDTRLLKKWVGGEDVVAADMYKSEVSFQPVAKLWFLANAVPVVQDASYGIWRRLVRFPFEVTIPPDQQDPDLLEKLIAEGPGIMKWIVDGCRAYLAEGLGEDPIAKAATAAWRSDSDQVGRWMNTAAVLVSGKKAARRAVRANYVAWCQAEGETPMDNKALAGELRRRGVEDGGTVRLDGNGSPVQAWAGIHLLEYGDRSDVAGVEPISTKPLHGELSKGGLPKQPTTSHYVTTREPGEDDIGPEDPDFGGAA